MREWLLPGCRLQEDEEEEEGQKEERRQYSFRDRALVTINPQLTLGGGGGGGHAGGDRWAARA